MIKRILIFLALLFSFMDLSAQRIDAIWPIGYDCCNHQYFGAINMDFTTGSLAIYMVQRHINLNNTCSSVCDSNGNLLFVTNGTYIANSLDDTMQNGNGLNPSYFTNQHLSAGLTVPQGNLVLPSLTDSNKYVLFHNTIDDYFNTGASLFLYTTTIDMSLNGGIGAVINKNTVIYNDSMTPGRIVATRHANGRDWWITVRKLHSLDLVEFLYTPTGISGPYFQSLLIRRDFNIGQSSFNPQGTKFAYYEAGGGLEVADFDRCTGQLNHQNYLGIIDSVYYGAGVCFSPNGRFLYVATVERVYQLDTWSANMNATKIVAGILDGFADPITSNITAFWILALGPDGKIYMSTGSSTPYLHVINNPDSLGTACDLCQHCIQLPALNAFTMPNFPNYSLGAEVGSVCDSLTNSVSDLHKINSEMSVYPNPTNGIFNFTLNSGSSNSILLQIYDTKGKIVYSEKIKEGTTSINLQSFAKGVYFYKLEGEKMVKSGKIVY